MSEEQSPKSNRSTPTPAGNQNLVIGLVLGAVVLLLFLLVLQISTGGLGGASAKPDELDDLKAQRDALLDRRGQSPAGGQGTQALADRLKRDSTTLADLATQLHAALAARESDLNGMRSLYQSTLAELNSANQKLLNANASGERANALQRDLADAQSRLQQANARVAELQQRLGSAPSASELEAMRSARNQAVQERDGFQRRLTELESGSRGMIAADQATSLSEDNARLRKEAADLEAEKNSILYELQKIRAELDRTRLFVEEIDELPAAAKQLYIELSKLDSATPAELNGEYEQIDQDLKAAPVDAIRFQTGSSVIDLDKVEEIRRVVQAANEDSYFLIVGYASTSGGLDQNRKLSSERATTIASVVNVHKKEQQGVRAVFLAETARFSPTDLAQNQVCEIWEIRK